VATGEPILEGSHLRRVFGDGGGETVALDDVSITLHGGEFTLLVGPSGSGKSTLLAVLSGLLRPTSGRVVVLGRDLWQMTDAERQEVRLQHFGFVFQGHNLFPALSARQQLALVLEWGAGASAVEARRRADDLLSLFELEARAGLRPAQLSGGEKQRVAVARALVKDPTFCFADEPTSSLGWEHGRQIVELLRDSARQRGKSVLVVSHDVRVRPYADHVYRLDDGRIEPWSGASAPEEVGVSS